MNQFQSTQDSGLLKETYGDPYLDAALKRKREKMATTRGIEVKETEDKDDKE